MINHRQCREQIIPRKEFLIKKISGKAAKKVAKKAKPMIVRDDHGVDHVAEHWVNHKESGREHQWKDSGEDMGENAGKDISKSNREDNGENSRESTREEMSASGPTVTENSNVVQVKCLILIVFIKERSSVQIRQREKSRSSKEETVHLFGVPQ